MADESEQVGPLLIGDAVDFGKNSQTLKEQSADHDHACFGALGRIWIFSFGEEKSEHDLLTWLKSFGLNTASQQVGNGAKAGMSLLEKSSRISESVIDSRSVAVFAKNDPNKGRFDGLAQQFFTGSEIPHDIVGVNIGGLADFLDGDPLRRIIEEQIGGRAEHFDGGLGLAETDLLLDHRPAGWLGYWGRSGLFWGWSHVPSVHMLGVRETRSGTGSGGKGADHR